MPELPPEVITNILIRLPEKPLLRFRSVSKLWCSEIDSPDFINLHLQTSSRRSLVLPHPDPQLLTIHSLDLHSLDRFVTFQDPPATETHLIGSCNGLLCTYKSITEIFIWNPLTRNHLKLPPMPFASSKGFDASSFYFSDMAYGFGYDSLHQDYKLMAVDRLDNTCAYSMKSNLWKSVSGLPAPFCPHQSLAVFASGALHWMMDSISIVEEKSLVIIAVDLGSLHYFPNLIKPPENGDRDRDYILGVLDGRLSMSCHHLDVDCVHVWVMKEYGFVSSWNKLLSIHVFTLIRPLAYSNSGNEVIMEGCCRKLLSYDLEKKTMESLQVQVCEWLIKSDEVPFFGDSTFEAQVFVGSLVKPVTAAGGDGGAIWKPGNYPKAKKRDGVLSKDSS